jgi:hypothetical protein
LQFAALNNHVGLKQCAERCAALRSMLRGPLPVSISFCGKRLPIRIAVKAYNQFLPITPISEPVSLYLRMREDNVTIINVAEK